MKEIPLSEFSKIKGQVEAARLLGVSAPAISKALSAGRKIMVVEHPDGTFTAEELRPFPSQPRRSAA